MAFHQLRSQSLFVSGGRNAERGMIALRVQDPTARQEEASNDRLLSFWSHKPGEQSYRSNDSRCPGDMFLIDTESGEASTWVVAEGL
jgi:hypothetical protein